MVAEALYRRDPDAMEPRRGWPGPHAIGAHRWVSIDVALPVLMDERSDALLDRVRRHARRQAKTKGCLVQVRIDRAPAGARFTFLYAETP